MFFSNEAKTSVKNIILFVASLFLKISAMIGLSYLIGFFLSKKILVALDNNAILARFAVGLFFILITYVLYHFCNITLENADSHRKTVERLPLTVREVRDLCMDTPWDYCFAMNYYFTYPCLPLFKFTPDYRPAYIHGYRYWVRALEVFQNLFGRMPDGFESDTPFDWSFWAKNEVRRKLELPNDTEIQVEQLRRVLSPEMLKHTGITLRDYKEDIG